MEVEIRDARASDRESIRRVARETWRETYDELDADTIEETVDEWYGDETLEIAVEGWYDEEQVVDIETVETPFLVAVVEGTVVGFVQGIVQGGDGDVLRLYVHPEFQKKGIGTRLFEGLVERFDEAEVSRLRALDLASNDASRSFFTGLGFERTGEGTVEIGGETYDEAVYTLDR